MRETGKGHTNLSTFNGLMNLPSPMHIISFIKIQDNFSEVYKQVAVISMQNAANEFSFSEVEGEKDKLINMAMIKHPI